MIFNYFLCLSFASSAAIAADCGTTPTGEIVGFSAGYENNYWVLRQLVCGENSICNEPEAQQSATNCNIQLNIDSQRTLSLSVQFLNGQSANAGTCYDAIVSSTSIDFSFPLAQVVIALSRSLILRPARNGIAQGLNGVEVGCDIQS